MIAQLSRRTVSPHRLDLAMMSFIDLQIQKLVSNDPALLQSFKDCAEAMPIRLETLCWANCTLAEGQYWATMPLLKALKLIRLVKGDDKKIVIECSISDNCAASVQQSQGDYRSFRQHLLTCHQAVLETHQTKFVAEFRKNWKKRQSKLKIKKNNQTTLDSLLGKVQSGAHSVMDWIVGTGQPLSTLENCLFRNMIATLNPAVDELLGGRKWGREFLDQCLTDLYAQLRVELEGVRYFSLSCDGWDFANGASELVSFHLYWVVGHQTVCRLIALEEVPGKCSTDQLARVFMRALAQVSGFCVLLSITCTEQT